METEDTNKRAFTISAAVTIWSPYNRKPGEPLDRVLQMAAITLPHDGLYLTQKQNWLKQARAKVRRFRLINATKLYRNVRNERDCIVHELTPEEFENAYNQCVIHRELIGYWSEKEEVSFQTEADAVLSQAKPYNGKIKIQEGPYGFGICSGSGRLSLEETEKIRSLIKAEYNKGLTKIVMELLNVQ